MQNKITWKLLFLIWFYINSCVKPNWFNRCLIDLLFWCDVFSHWKISKFREFSFSFFECISICAKLHSLIFAHCLSKLHFENKVSEWFLLIVKEIRLLWTLPFKEENIDRNYFVLLYVLYQSVSRSPLFW